jgi:hypothetical protein
LTVNQLIKMKKTLKKIFNLLGYTISKNSKILLLDEDPFIAIKDKIVGDKIVLVDIGANLGQTIMKMSNHYSNAKIYAFEPIKNCFEALKINLKIVI